MATETEQRNFEAEQLKTVTKLFAENNIDLAFAKAGRTLYQSLRQAKTRTKNRKYYEGVEYRFNNSDKKALLEVIQGDRELWESWVKQQEIYDTTGDEFLRPTLHRPNPDGNYEFGNIAMLSYEEHLQENAKPVIVLDTDAGTLTTYKTQTEFQKVESVSRHKVEKMNKAFREDEISAQRKKAINWQKQRVFENLE